MEFVGKQKTIKNSVSYSGIGIHSGKPATVVFKEAIPGTGIVFVRIDLPGKPVIKADPQLVSATMRATTLTVGDASVFTVEHIMAALFILDIDNCIIELDGPEPPVADGSALPFVELLKTAKIIEQETLKDIYEIEKPLSIYDNDRYVMINPYKGLRFSFLSINKHPLLGTQYFDIEIGKDDILKEVAPARTIAFMHEVEALRKMGLGLGGNAENVIVYDDNKVLTPLRFEDELVRHKMLDLFGDLFLTGRFFGHVIAVKSGHELNTRLARKLADYKKGVKN